MSIHSVTIHGLHLGREMQNVIHLENADGLLTHQQIAGHVANSWLPHILGAQSHNIQYYELEVRQKHPVNNLAGDKIPISIFGNGSSDLHHGVMSYKLLFKTGLIGRRFRGRYYIPACVQGFTTNDVVNTAGNTFLTNAALQLTAAWCGSGGVPGLSLVIYHRGAEPSWTQVTSIIHSNVLGIQSRRNVGRGI